jgi:hypothetical protein
MDKGHGLIYRWELMIAMLLMVFIRELVGKKLGYPWRKLGAHLAEHSGIAGCGRVDNR